MFVFRSNPFYSETSKLTRTSNNNFDTDTDFSVEFDIFLGYLYCNV